MRVGVDTSPLVQTRAGTARHRPRAARRACATAPGSTSSSSRSAAPGALSSVVRDALWYPVGLRAAGARARRPPLHDVPRPGRLARADGRSRCTTSRSCARPRRSLAGTGSTGRAGLERVLRAADAIVAVSEFTSSEATELVGVPAERIRVVPNGVDAVFDARRPARGRRLRARGRDARAAEEPRPRRRGRSEAGVELRVVGARGWGGVDVPGWVGEMPDAELAALYRGARCVVYPSLYEGFGLPVLEAMACGTPVVTSRETAMEEVAGDGRRPRRPARRRPRSRRASARLSRAATSSFPPGLARAREFTWDRAADAVVDALAGARVKVVAFDADVLGRQRTGDETYALNLLRELGPLAPEAGIRLVAVTRHPELVPDGVEPYELGARSQELRMAWIAAASTSQARRCPLPHAARAAAAPALPVRRHRPRRVVRARPVADGLEGPDDVPPRGPARGTERGTRPHRVRAHEGGSRRALPGAGRAHRRHAERRRPRLLPGSRGRTTSSSPSERSRHGRTSSPRSTLPRQSVSRSSSRAR